MAFSKKRRVPIKEYKTYEAAYQAAVRHNRDADRAGHKNYVAIVEGPDDNWTVMDLRDAIDAEMPYEVPQSGLPRSGRAVSGQAGATDGSGWWLLGGLAVVGGVVAAVLWWQSKPKAAAPTVRRNGVLPMSPVATNLPPGTMANRPQFQIVEELEGYRQQVVDSVRMGLRTPAEGEAEIARLRQEAEARGIDWIRWPSFVS